MSHAKCTLFLFTLTICVLGTFGEKDDNSHDDQDERMSNEELKHMLRFWKRPDGRPMGGFRFGYGKRDDDVMDEEDANAGMGAFRFGYGKRAYSGDFLNEFRFGKRRGMDGLRFGYGKRNMGNLRFGYGKRDMGNLRFGYGKRNMDGLRFGYGKRSMDNLRFGYGKRAFTE